MQKLGQLKNAGMHSQMMCKFGQRAMQEHTDNMALWPIDQHGNLQADNAGFYYTNGEVK